MTAIMITLISRAIKPESPLLCLYFSIFVRQGRPFYFFTKSRATSAM